MRTPSLSAFSHWADFTSLKNPPKGDSCLHVLANLLHVGLTVEIVLDVQNLRDVLICPDNSGYLIQLWLALKPRCRSAVSTRRHAQAMCQTQLIHRASALLWQEEVRFWVMAQLPAQLDAQLPVGWKNVEIKRQFLLNSRFFEKSRKSNMKSKYSGLLRCWECNRHTRPAGLFLHSNLYCMCPREPSQFRTN